MLWRIEAVISTAGNNEEYVGQKLGETLLGRPLKRMVVTFEEEISHEEMSRLTVSLANKEFVDKLRSLMGSKHAIVVHSIRMTRNFQH